MNLKKGELSFYSIIADEYTDASNLEQLTVSFRWLDDDLHALEDFTGFYQIPDISANTEKELIKRRVNKTATLTG